MKILKIRFENIHSLKGEHEVDFGDGPLAEAGLFAITGPTGSGKSTLLDVITLALYNRIARVDKPVSNSILEDDGGIMTRNMGSCYAEVEYRVNGKNYRSHWSIERNRNNNLNARKQELVELATNMILESGTKTPEKNLEIIGLSYDQFIKAMVLSQGEFSKLLQSPRNERNRLLEDITGAKSYREIGKAVFFRYKGIEKSIGLVEAKLEGIEILSSEVIAAKKTELKNLTKSKPEIEKGYQNASDKIKLREELQKKHREQKILETEKQTLIKDLEIFKPYKVQLETHDKLSEYRESIRAYDDIVIEAEKLDENFKNLEKSKSEAELHQKSYLKTVSELIKEEVDIEFANNKLETFRAKISELEAEANKKHSEALLHQNQLNNYGRNIKQLGYKLPEAESPENFILQLESFENDLHEFTTTSGIRNMEELSANLNLTRQKYEKAGDLISKKEQDVKLQNYLEDAKSKLNFAEQSLKSDSSLISNLEKEVPELEKDVEFFRKSIEQQRKHQSLEESRKQLEPDKPCPLCGSLHHPYATSEPHFDAKEILLKERQESLKTKSQLLVALLEKSKLQSKNISDLNKNIIIASEEKQIIKRAISKLANDLQWNIKETLENYLEHRAELSHSIQQMENSKRIFQAQGFLPDLKESLKNWTSAVHSYKSLNTARLNLYEGKDINDKSAYLSSKLNQSIAEISSYAKQLREKQIRRKSAKAERDKQFKILEHILEKEKLENLEILRTGILAEERARKIRNREAELKERNVRISEKNRGFAEDLKKLTEKDDPRISLETLTSLFDESKKHWDILLVNIGKIAQSLEEDENNKRRQQTVIDELNLLKKDLALWKSMNDLIGDATGNKFSNFVQDLTLEQLIGFANKRLSEFSDRYLLDIPTAHEAEKSDTLKIFDSYMGNARRSVKTLSGGETFLVSLAMAFALSDIAARNVKIESLFIDEGFGTLDPETLDQAITILEKMQNEGDKSVGIISHVSALKERITTQIKLEKGSLGYSTLEVVQ